jgi:hypothetical protein
MAKASTKKTPARTKVIDPNDPPVVTREEFDALAGNVSALVDIIKEERAARASAPAQPAHEETAIEKEVRKAAPDENPVNPAWIEKAEEILGDALDHCEVAFPKRGGTIFTVVITEDASNAPPEYLERMRVDRRSREIGNEGIEGVEQWCKLVASNLKRPKPTSHNRD